MPGPASSLTLAFSPCPNDTFMFHGLVSGLVPSPAGALQVELLDIEELNQRALDPRRSVAVTKLSVAAYAAVRERYALLDAGAAMGRGCGPLVVRAAARADVDTLAGLSGKRVAIPGERTTAALLLRCFAPRDLAPVTMRFDRVLPAVAHGEVDAGVIIHESRFTYPEHGLVAVADLGELWEGRSGQPVPLGVVVARRDLGAGVIAAIDAAVRASVELARAQPSLSRDYVRAHARELSEEVCRRHIELYVNDWSVSLGPAGRRSIAELLGAARG